MGIAPYSPARRVVTGHDSTGKAIVLIDDNTPYTARRDEKTLQQRIWVTDKFPVDMSGDKDRGGIEVRIAPPPTPAASSTRSAVSSCRSMLLLS